MTTDLIEIFQGAREASYIMALIQTEDKNEALLRLSQLLLEHKSEIINENKKDMENAVKANLAQSLLSRLLVDEKKIEQLAKGCQELAKLKDPIGQVTLNRELDTGLVLTRKTVPLGVVGVIFESRPDVLIQIATLILKSGNVGILKGGREAYYTNQALLRIIHLLSKDFSFFPKAWLTLLDSREEVAVMLNHPEYIDLIIPRGSSELVRSIKENTRIPVLGHADGVCHLYVHEKANIAEAIKIAIDSKTQYPAACNSIETLLVDATIAKTFLLEFSKSAAGLNIDLIGCEKSVTILKNIKSASESDWWTEYGDLRLSIKVVTGLQEAMNHINKYGSHHTDAIVTQDTFAAEIFLNGVDSASVYHNASTRFADGFRYGFGAEVGVSTEKIHARGPVGLDGLVSYKYFLRGSGQIVETYSSGKSHFTHKDIDV